MAIKVIGAKRPFSEILANKIKVRKLSSWRFDQQSGHFFSDRFDLSYIAEVSYKKRNDPVFVAIMHERDEYENPNIYARLTEDFSDLITELFPEYELEVKKDLTLDVIFNNDDL